MTDQTTAGESSVDTLRRRARRRLVGAAVLALGAAVALPLIFEKEPPPLPAEVDIRIPPVDKTPFDPKADAAKSGAKVSGEIKVAPISTPTKTASSPLPPLTKPEEPAFAQKEEPKAAVSLSAMPDTASAPIKAEPKAPASVEMKAPPKAEPKVEAKLETKAEAPKPVNEDGPKTEPKAGDYVVQLIAVRDLESAKAVLGKARELGYNTAYRERVDVSNGVVNRVRVGPYKDKAFAEKIRAKLATQNFEPVLVQVK
jgi:DedD protein